VEMHFHSDVYNTRQVTGFLLFDNVTRVFSKGIVSRFTQSLITFMMYAAFS